MLAGVSLLAAVLAVAALLFGAWSGRRANQAARQARLALARQLAADSLNQLDSNNDLAWLLAIEGGRRGETVETFSALRRAIAHPGHTLTILSGHEDKVNQAVWNADESRVLTASNDGTARVWDTATGTQLMVLTGHQDWVNTAIWNADGSRVTGRSERKSVSAIRRFDMPVATLKAGMNSCHSRVTLIGFSRRYGARMKAAS